MLRKNVPVNFSQRKSTTHSRFKKKRYMHTCFLVKKTSQKGNKCRKW